MKNTRVNPKRIFAEFIDIHCKLEKKKMCNIHSKDKQERECCVCRICFLVSLAVSVLLIVGGFLMPPKGEISGSVLTAVGELAAFPTLAYGFRAIMMGMEIHINHGNTHIEITKDED